MRSMATYEVQCIVKGASLSASERISDVEVKTPQGDRKRYAVADVLEMIKEGDHFTILGGGPDAHLVKATMDGRDYVKANSDGDQPENLLKLGECPPEA
jgi:hypothetical protein